MNSKCHFLPAKPPPSLPPTAALLLFTVVFFIYCPLLSCQNNNINNTLWYSSCSRSFSCGEVIRDVDYPFWGGNRTSECGHPGMELRCVDGNKPIINIMNVNYRILSMDPATQLLKITRDDIFGDICPHEFVNTTLDFTIFEFTSGYVNFTVQYGCPAPINIPLPNQLTCTIGGVTYQNGYILPGVQGRGACRASIFVPIRSSPSSFGELTNLRQLLEEGFEVRWKVDSKSCSQCRNSINGTCGYDLKTSNFTCLCPDPDDQGFRACRNVLVDADQRDPRPVSSGGNGGVNTRMNIGLAIAGAVIAGFGLGFLIFFCRQRRKRLVVAAASSSSQIVQIESKELPTTPLAKKAASVPSDALTKTIIPSYASTKSEFGRSSSYFGIQVFNYPELEEATANFSRSRELGDGGFGAVYYGILRDGRIVAVKRLYENNFKRVEQFINEVEILTRLRHTNLVTLYGCTSKRSQELLLVYEYVPNGTVADHLHGKRSKSGLLSWPIRLNIAIETAEALAYLHASDIIHRDVKTNNILLDNEFHVKVADFGLSRLFPNDVTHISTAPQGTPGYVDPEYYQCYRLTDKSDVYSFGVVLLELLSSLQAVDTNRHRQDINLANMGINKIQNHTLQELVDPSLGFGRNCSARRTMTQVSEIAFRCLQQERDMRPSMQEVLDVLRRIQNKEGLINALKNHGGGSSSSSRRHVKDNDSPHSPNSVTDKWASNSTPSSSV